MNKLLGSPDVAVVSRALGDRTRIKILLALADGRALPASLLASEAGVGLPTISAHLAKLSAAGLVTASLQGRHRYYGLASPDVAAALEALTRISPPGQITSLREGTRARALREARTCYDHVAGRLGVDLMERLLRQQALTGGSGEHELKLARSDRLAAPGRDIQYELTDSGRTVLEGLGIDVEATRRKQRPFIRYCVDWSEQRHHVAGALGAAITGRLFELEWIRRGVVRRSVVVTDIGRDGLDRTFGPSKHEPVATTTTG